MLREGERQDQSAEGVGKVTSGLGCSPRPGLLSPLAYHPPTHLGLFCGLYSIGWGWSEGGGGGRGRSPQDKPKEGPSERQKECWNTEGVCVFSLSVGI